MADRICCARATSPLVQTSEKAAPYVTREGLSSNATRLSMKLVEDSLKVLLAVHSFKYHLSKTSISTRVLARAVLEPCLIQQPARPLRRSALTASSVPRLLISLHFIQVIFSQMADDGLWRKGEPIYSAHGEMNGRDIGNAYVFAYDMLGTILHVFEDEPTLFVPYVPQLEK